MKEYKNKKCLVTGGTGLIGRQVVDLLIKSGARVFVVSLDNLHLNEWASYLTVDLRELWACIRFTENEDYIFHLAGIKSSPKITKEKPATMSVAPLQINTNILEACRINKIQNVLFTSSIGAYAEDEILKEKNAYLGDPMDSAPGEVKRMAEKQIQWYNQEFGLNYKVVRLTNTYGPGDNFDPDNGMFIPSLMAKVLRGDNPVEIWGDGSQIRDFAYSKDIAKGILLMMLKAPDYYPINLGGGRGYSVQSVVRLLSCIIDFNCVFNGDKPSGVYKRILDISRAKSLGYKPNTPLIDGLRETWEWFKEHSSEYKLRKNYFTEG